MRFAKLHGLGNDFVLLDLRGGAEEDAAQIQGARLARRICDRHRGIGADGLMILRDVKSGEADGLELAARLVIYNPDGSRPEMCGNGARCAALWIATAGCTKTATAKVLLLTDAGPRTCAVDARETPWLGSVEIDMGRARVEAERALPLSSGAHPATPVSMGNPHRVLFFNELPQKEIAQELAALCGHEGPALCKAEDANIEFVRWLGSDVTEARIDAVAARRDETVRRDESVREPMQRFVVSVWERGAGQTDACGTGACAVAGAAIARGMVRADEPIAVQLPGGELIIRALGGSMKMTGAAELVFVGELPRG